MTERHFRFFQWNDLHVRDRHVAGRSGGYPGCNEKVAGLPLPPVAKSPGSKPRTSSSPRVTSFVAGSTIRASLA